MLNFLQQTKKQKWKFYTWYIQRREIKMGKAEGPDRPLSRSPENTADIFGAWIE